MTNEIWKDISGYPGYKVSNTGLVLNRHGRLLSLNEKGKGYFAIRLFNNYGRTQILIHRLVLITFKGLEIGKQVNHINGIKTDNRVENLEWCTASENHQHRFRALGHKATTKEVMQYDLRGNFIKKWESLISIERNLGISFQAIWMCCNGKTKTSGGYKWKYFI